MSEMIFLPASVGGGALFSLIKGFVDHGARHVFARVTGAWPGDENTEPQ